MYTLYQAYVHVHVHVRMLIILTTLVCLLFRTVIPYLRFDLLLFLFLNFNNIFVVVFDRFVYEIGQWLHVAIV